MSDFSLDLARRFDGVPLVPGMVANHSRYHGRYIVMAAAGDRVLLTWMRDGTEVEPLPVMVPMGWVDRATVTPDYRDPGTLGHILAAVRAAWKDPGAAVTGHETVPPGDLWWVFDACGPSMRDSVIFAGPTEAHALAAAWEGRPR